MKKYPKLWDRLIVDATKLSTIKRDWTEGKVPDLPFVIIDQKDVKDHIQRKLENIDGDRMQTTILQAQYGDGKTNVFKYLELYFKSCADSNIKFIYCRANPDQTDLCMFLMQHIQMSCMEDLKQRIKELYSEPKESYASLAGNFENDFAAIQEYTCALFDQKNSENIENLIFLGTGRLYSKGMFDKFGLEKLTDFNRREVFVLFMNILASAGLYLVFTIDELEKINDKSIKRMAHFFTSYRELMDLFNKINGHYLISAITNGVDIAGLSQPFFERVKMDKVMLNTLREDEDITELITLMADLLDKHIEEAEVKGVVGKVKRKSKELNNRRMIQFISDQLLNVNTQIDTSLDDILARNQELSDIYAATLKKLQDDGGFSNLSRAFFDPLEYYLTALGYSMNGNYRRDYQAVVDDDMHKAFFFLFNDDTKIKERIAEFSENKDIHDFVIFSTDKMDVNYAMLQPSDDNIKIVEYEPEKLFVLLNMYRWNFDKQKEISKVLNIATLNVF